MGLLERGSTSPLPRAWQSLGSHPPEWRWAEKAQKLPSRRRPKRLFHFISPNHSLGSQGNVVSLHRLPSGLLSQAVPLLALPEVALFPAWRGCGTSDTITSARMTAVKGQMFTLEQARENPTWATLPCGLRGPLCGIDRSTQQLPYCCMQSAPSEFTDPTHWWGHLVSYKHHRIHLCQAPCLHGFPENPFTGVGGGNLP